MYSTRSVPGNSSTNQEGISTPWFHRFHEIQCSVQFHSFEESFVLIRRPVSRLTLCLLHVDKGCQGNKGRSKKKHAPLREGRCVSSLLCRTNPVWPDGRAAFHFQDLLRADAPTPTGAGLAVPQYVAVELTDSTHRSRGRAHTPSVSHALAAIPRVKTLNLQAFCYEAVAPAACRGRKTGLTSCKDRPASIFRKGPQFDCR
jgi:hypothetical protein